MRHFAFGQRMRISRSRHTLSRFDAAKAMGDLDCKGYTCIFAEDIERIEGLKVQQRNPAIRPLRD